MAKKQIETVHQEVVATHQHTHESHVSHAHDTHEHHQEETFITKYIFSEDHKTISKQFLISGMIWAVIGAFLSVVFRLQLGFPNATFPWLEDILGRWAAGGKISPDTYYAFITMHGTILVFFVLTAGLSGTFSNFLIPLQIGARDMASGFLNMLSYWFFFLSSIIMLASFFTQTGPAAGGWVLYPPLSALGEASQGSKIGVDLWIISMAIFVVSSLLGSLNYISTILNLRTQGMSMTRMPLTIWAFLFTAILGVLAFPPLVSALILLLFDRHGGTSFYLSDIFINGTALANEGGSAILYQHLFWFLGHPEVYIIIFPAMGIVSEILSINSRKPIFGYSAMVFSIAAICFIGFFVWAHHMFVSGMNPFLGSIFTLATLIIAIPSSVKVFNWLTTLWKGNIKLTPQMLFAIGFVSVFISGGLTGIHLGNAALDIHLHDSYFVIAHFHLVMGVAALFGMIAGVYHWFPKMYGRYMNTTLGYIHFWGTIIAAYVIFWPMHYQGLAGMPRRYYEYASWKSFNQFETINIVISIAAIIAFLLQILFLINFFHSIFRGRKVLDRNPWKATTLEWTTTNIQPGHGNWDGEIPTVYRGAYDYAKDGRDFIPQTEPVSESESKH